MNRGLGYGMFNLYSVQESEEVLLGGANYVCNKLLNMQVGVVDQD